MIVLSEKAAEIFFAIPTEGITFRELKECFSDDDWTIMKAVRELRSHGVVDMSPRVFVDTAIISRTVRFVAGQSFEERILEAIPAEGIRYGALRQKLSQMHEGQIISIMSALNAACEIKITPDGALNDNTFIEVISVAEVVL